METRTSSCCFYFFHLCGQKRFSVLTSCHVLRCPSSYMKTKSDSLSFEFVMMLYCFLLLPCIMDRCKANCPQTQWLQLIRHIISMDEWVWWLCWVALSCSLLGITVVMLRWLYLKTWAWPGGLVSNMPSSLDCWRSSFCYLPAFFIGWLNIPTQQQTSWGCSMMVNVECQLDRLWNHFRDKPLGRSVEDFLDYVNWGWMTCYYWVALFHGLQVQLA